jgi:hypothetical protein
MAVKHAEWTSLDVQLPIFTEVLSLLFALLAGGGSAWKVSDRGWTGYSDWPVRSAPGCKDGRSPGAAHRIGEEPVAPPQGEGTERIFGVNHRRCRLSHGRAPRACNAHDLIRNASPTWSQTPIKSPTIMSYRFLSTRRIHIIIF